MYPLAFDVGYMAYLRGINAFRLNPENTAADYIYYDKPIVKYEYTGHYNTYPPSLRID